MESLHKHDKCYILLNAFHIIVHFSQLRSDSYDLAVEFITSQGEMTEAPGCPDSQNLFHLMSKLLVEKQDVATQCDLIKTDNSEASHNNLVGIIVSK